MDTGILYIAVGEDFVDEAKRSLESVRAEMGGIDVAIATDSKEYDLGAFDHVILLDETNQLDIEGRTFLYDTTISPDLSPFDRTIYLDTDTYVCDDVSELFGLLDDVDLAIAWRPDQTPIPELDKPWGHYNAGVIAYRDTEETRELLANWQETFRKRAADQDVPADQPSFVIALANSDVRWFTLPQRYNVRNSWRGELAHDAKILHTRKWDFEEAAEVLNSVDGHRVYRRTWKGTPAVRKRKITRSEELGYRIGPTISKILKFVSILRRDGLRSAISRTVSHINKKIRTSSQKHEDV